MVVESILCRKMGAGILFGDETKTQEDTMTPKPEHTLAQAASQTDFQELLENFPRGKMKEFANDKEKMKEFEALYKEFGQIIKDIKTISG